MLKIAYSHWYKHSLPTGHRFPMLKYELILEQLLYEGGIHSNNLFEPEPLNEQTILLTHELAYWRRIRNLELTPKEMRRIGFPLSERLVNRSIVIANGTVQGALFTQQYGIAMNVGGTHHAFADRGGAKAFVC